MQRYEKVRAFIAVDIEEPTVVSRIASIRDAFVATGAPMKPVETENLHITLRFLGDTPLALIDELEQLLRRAAPRRVEIRLRGVGAFPSPERPRVIWIGVEQGPGYEELQRIQRVIERGVRELGWRPEREEFIPHVTIARLKGRRNLEKVVKLLNELQDVEIGTVYLEAVRLKQSILTRAGPIYRTLREVQARQS